MGAKDENSGKDDKAARLAEALRENLKRRKGQARARRAAAHENASAPQVPDVAPPPTKPE